MTSTNPDPATYEKRLVSARSTFGWLASQTPHPDARTLPDPGGTEVWDWGQVWAHLAEFCPYWVTQAGIILAAPPNVAAHFGRTKKDEGRIAAIARDKSAPIPGLCETATQGLDLARSFIQGCKGTDWARQGRHPTLGVMTLAVMVDEFIVGHIEEHINQFKLLLAPNP